MDTQESMSEYPALQIGADLSLDEPGNRGTLPPRPSQEGFELFTNDLVQKRLFGLVAFVFDGGKQSIGTMRARALPAIASDVPRSPERDEADARSRLVHLRSRKRLKNRAQPFTRSVETCVLVVARRKMNKRGELSKRHTPGRPKDLRDTYASTLITHGIVLKWVSLQLGHANLGVTERHYSSYMAVDSYQNPWIVPDGCMPPDLFSTLDQCVVSQLSQTVTRKRKASK